MVEDKKYDSYELGRREEEEGGKAFLSNYILNTREPRETKKLNEVNCALFYCDSSPPWHAAVTTPKSMLPNYVWIFATRETIYILPHI